jgi:hypothetical protein
MKITVLGRGNAGCLTALHYHYYGKVFKKNIEVELIYDDKIPTLTVGQATTLELPEFLWKALGTDYYSNSKDLNYTMKTGIMYEDWGKINKNIFHCFSMGSYALHYDTQVFQNHILKNADFKIKIINDHVLNYDKIDSDYIFDCRGWPKNNNDYESLVNPLNAVVCSNLKRKNKEPDWTRAVATPDGWCFYIPLHNTVSLGYMYNSKITTKTQAIKNFKKQFKINHIRESFPFKQYIAKNPIKDNRIIYNGNRLFFLEPLESTSVATYIHWNRIVWDSIIEKKYSLNDASLYIKDYTKKIQNFILWHYSFGSKYNTPFWKYSKKLSQKIKDENFYEILDFIKKYDISDLRNLNVDNNSNLKYSQWEPWSFKLWQEGMTKKFKV